MPSPREQTRARRGLTDYHVAALLTGRDHHGAFVWERPSVVSSRHREGWDKPQHVEAKLRKAVNEFGDDLLSDWIAAHPRTRPWFWWRFLAPEALPAGESQAAFLARHGLLTESEVTSAVTA